MMLVYRGIIILSFYKNIKCVSIHCLSYNDRYYNIDLTKLNVDSIELDFYFVIHCDISSKLPKNINNLTINFMNHNNVYVRIYDLIFPDHVNSLVINNNHSL